MDHDFPDHTMTDSEIEALRFHGILNDGRVYPWWMHDESWKARILRKYDEMRLLFEGREPGRP
jgi:hypothetical protein